MPTERPARSEACTKQLAVECYHAWDAKSIKRDRTIRSVDRDHFNPLLLSLPSPLLLLLLLQWTTANTNHRCVY